MPSPQHRMLSISRGTPFLTSSPKIHWSWLLIAGQSFSSNKCTYSALSKETRPEMQTRDVSPPATARSVFPTYNPENGPVDYRALLAGVCATAQSIFILFCLKIYSSSCRKTRHRFRGQHYVKSHSLPSSIRASPSSVMTAKPQLTRSTEVTPYFKKTTQVDRESH